jgi:DNA-binding transcriptional LysR family regulator
LWSEPLLWAYAAGRTPDWTKPLAVAFFPDPCPYRSAAVAVLDAQRRHWRLACSSPSVAGVQAMALAGLAVTPLTRSAFAKGMDALADPDRLPPLPDAHFALQLGANAKSAPVRELVVRIHDAARDLRQ